MTCHVIQHVKFYFIPTAMWMGSFTGSSHDLITAATKEHEKEGEICI